MSWRSWLTTPPLSASAARKVFGKRTPRSCDFGTQSRQCEWTLILSSVTGSSGESTLGPWTRQSEWSGIVVNVSSESCVGTQLRSFGVILNQQGYPAATVSCVLGLCLLIHSEWPLTNKVIGSRESREGTLPLSLPRRLIQDRHWRQLQDSQRSEKGGIPSTRRGGDVDRVLLATNAVEYPADGHSSVVSEWI